MTRRDVEVARRLRSQSTDAERKLWQGLRSRQLGGVKFRRHYALGRYFLDFYSTSHRLAIEVDGAQHLEEAQATYDCERTEYLQSLGIEVLRFTNLDVLNALEGVPERIWESVASNPGGRPSPFTSEMGKNPLPLQIRRIPT